VLVSDLPAGLIPLLMALTIIVTAVVTLLLAVVAMNFATSEKQLERKIDHRHPVRDPQFRREMSVMMGPAILPGNRVTALQNGDEIFPAMLRAIRSAQVSITFETYIYWSGEIGREFSEALCERAEAVCLSISRSIGSAASRWIRRCSTGWSHPASACSAIGRCTGTTSVA